MSETNGGRPVMVGDRRLPLRFWVKVVESRNGCWLWTAGQRRGGYGRFRTGGKGSPTTVSHRYAYEYLVGVVPHGLQLDHLCRNRLCCNPNHLEPVTPRENTLRGLTSARMNASKTHCPQGHEYNTKNTRLIKKGARIERHCRLCGRDNMRAFRARKRGLAA
jgi:hypothetical protein